MSTEDNVPSNYEDSAGFDLYKKFRGPINPYTLYNNQDRFLNVAYRYYTSGNFKDRWRAEHAIADGVEINPLGYLLDNATYEHFTNTMSQYFWMQMGWLGLGYSLVTNPGTISTASNHDNDQARRDLSKDEYIVGVFRSTVNMVDETLLYFANAYRYKYEKEATGHRNYRDGGANDFLSNHQEEIRARKLTRARMGKWGSSLFVLNALVGVGMTSTKLDFLNDEDRSHFTGDQNKAFDAQLDSTKISLGAIIANTLANTMKAVSSQYMELHLRDPEAIAAGDFMDGAVPLTNEQKSIRASKAGTALGLANGVLNIASLLPILINDPNLSERDKTYIEAEMAMQTGAGLLHWSSNVMLARRLSSPLGAAGGIAGPAFGVFLGGIFASLSMLEILGLIKQSEYADNLAELGKKTRQYGYLGDTMLSELYREKVESEQNTLIGTTVLTAIGSAVEVATLLLGVSGPAVVFVEVVVALTSLIVKGVQQIEIENIASRYIRKIKAQGGSDSFFSNNMSATFIQYFTTPEMQRYLKDLQSQYGVDSVVGIASTKIAVQALELAAYTKYAAQLRTAETQMYRFNAGEMAIDNTIHLSDELGLIDLRDAKASDTNKSQLVKFLSPLMAPGSETRARTSTDKGKNAYYTTLDIAVTGGGWQIKDGDLNSIFDVQNVVTQVSNNENKPILNVELHIDGGAGDDTVIAGVGKTDFDGGAGFDTISYRAITGLDDRLLVTADHVDSTDGEFTVLKKSSLAPIYQETTGVQGYSYGKRAETVEYREIKVTRIEFSETDHLHQVENIYGSIGNDDFTGNAAINYFHGEAGNDIIRAMRGADVISGGMGNDTLDGGAGVDTADYSDNFERAAGIVARLETPGRPAYLQTIDGLPAIYGSVEEQWQPSGIAKPISAIDKLVSIENLIGTKFSDTISGSVVDNYLDGAAGDDLLEGLSGGDTLVGGDGNDVVDGGDDDDLIIGGDGNDALNGGAGNDFFTQKKGGATDNDAIDGGDGIDTLDYGEFDVKDQGINADLQAGAIDKDWDAANSRYNSRDTVSHVENIIGTPLNDTLLGDDVDNILAGDAGNDNLAGRAGNDTLAGGQGSDTLNGGAGVDIADFGQSSGAGDGGIFVTLNDDPGLASIAAFGHLSANGAFEADSGGRHAKLIDIEAVMGTAFSDRISGNGANNILAGNDGDDRLEGRGGNDTLHGGNGADDIDGGAGDDTINQDIDTDNDTLDGGDGEDTLDYYINDLAFRRMGLAAGAGITVDLKAGRVDKYPGSTLAGEAGFDVIRNFERVVGTNRNDQISGDALANALFGGAGDDALAGDDGNDFLYGGGGNDTVLGGSGKDTLTGGEGMDFIDGGDGNDVFSQEIDALYYDIDVKSDTLKGGAGIDTVDYSRIIFNDSQRASLNGFGIDADLALGQIKKFQGLVSSGDRPVDFVEAIENVVGSKLSDAIRGDAQNNGLSGDAGEDLLDGRDGNDSLNGGDSADTLIGGNGNDSLDGSNGDDSLAGGDGFNVLTGGVGNDTIIGGDSDDAIFQHLFHENDVIDGGAGIDTLDYNVTTFHNPSTGISINVDLQSQQVEKFEAGVRVGRDSVNRVENVIGNVFNDTMAGDAGANLLAGREGNDSLSGLAGNDVLDGDNGEDKLDGGAGDDMLAGGLGNDTMDGGAGADTYTFIVNGGMDVITDNSSEAGVADTISYNGGIAATDLWFRQVGNHLEILVLGSSAKVTVTNWFVSSDWQIESIRLDDGHNITNVQVATLLVVMAPYATVPSTAAALPADVLAAIRTTWGLSTDSGAATPRIMTGTPDNDALVAGSGGYLLQGLDGADTLGAGTGPDTIEGGAGDDYIVQLSGVDNDLLNGGAGADTVDYSVAENGSISAVLSAGKVYKNNANGVIGIDTLSEVEHIFATSANDTIMGDGAHNALSGAAGNDFMSGAAGNDTLSGGSGNDTLNGGADADVVLGGSGDDLILQAVLLDQDTMDGGAGKDTLDYSGMDVGANQVGGLRADLIAGLVEKLQNGAVAGTDAVANIERLLATIFNDTITAGAGTESISGGAGDDHFMQVILRTKDTLDGGSGSDTVDYSRDPAASRGWLGSTGINGNLATGRVDKFEVASIDAFDTLNSIENIVGSRLDDTLTGNQFANNLQGNAGNDTLRASDGNDTLDGGEGVDMVDYAAAAGPIAADLAQLQIVKTAPGNPVDSLRAIENVTGTQFNDTMSGDASNNVLIGGAGNDSLNGAAGDDSLAGGAGNDTLLGGSGNDSLAGNAGDDRFMQDASGGDDAIDGGEDIDTVDYSLFHASPVQQGAVGPTGIRVDLTQSRIDKFIGGAAIGLDRIANIENIIGSAHNDTLIGDGLANMMSGGDGDDRLVQQFFKDSDSLSGGNGLDTVDYSNLQSPVGTFVTLIVDLAAGTAEKYSQGSLAGTDQLASIEQVRGYRFNDSISGSVAGDALFGLDGNDTLSGNAGNDTLAGGKDADLMQGGDGNDLILQVEFTGDDSIDGGNDFDIVDYSQATAAGMNIVVNVADNKIYKYSGTTLMGIDTLTSVEKIIGTGFNDVLNTSAVADNLAGGAGNDTVKASEGNDTLDGGADLDTLDYSQAGVTGGLRVNLADGTVTKHANGNIDSVSHFEVVIGTASDDQFVLASGTETIDGGAGVDAVDYSRTGLPGSAIAATDTTGILADLKTGAVTLFGGTRTGTLQNIEKVTGSSFNDTLIASGSTQSLAGDDGTDLIVAAFRTDSQTLAYDGGDGFDTLDFSKMELASNDTYKVRVDLSTGRIERSGTKNGSAWAVATDSVQGMEQVIGTRFNDTIIGSGNEDYLAGADGNDIIDGGAGNDALDGGKGNDSLAGGTGDDILVGSIGTDTLDGGSGTDTLDYSELAEELSVLATLGDGIVKKFNGSVLVGQDSLRNIDILIGSRGADTITGSANSETLSGGDGADILKASAGNDTLDGGRGSDTADYSNADRTGIVADLGNGAVSKFSNWSTVSGASGTDTLIAIDNVIGTAFNDGIIGDIAANAIEGNAGDDTLDGGLGEDTLSGGIGADLVAGGEGDDRLVQSVLGDSDTLDGGAGFDIIDYSTITNGSINVRFSDGKVTKYQDGQLAPEDVMWNVEGVIGTRFNDTLSGATSDESLSGGDGNDVITGSRGNDMLDGGNGIDTLDYSIGMVGAIVGDLSGPAGRVDKYKDGVLDGSDQVSRIEILIGTDFADTIIGSAGAETIKAGQGDDLILQTLSRSRDVLDGGKGNDTVDYSRNAAVGQRAGLGRAGIIANLATGRIDKFEANSTDAFDTVTGIENVTGSDYNDTIAGDANANLLSGSLGDDILKASGGNDMLDGGDGLDTADYSSITSAYVVIDLGTSSAGKYENGLRVSSDLIRNTERIVGTSGNDKINGGASDEALSGGAGNDTLSGGTGNDTLDSGTGNDVLDGGAGVDSVSYSGIAGGIDADLDSGMVKKYATESNRTSFETDMIASIEKITGSNRKDKIYGDALANYFAGNAGADTLIGNAGDDTLNGGADADSVAGGDGNDVLLQDAFAGNDTLDGGAGVDVIDYSATAGGNANDVVTISADMATGKISKRVNGIQTGLDTLRIDTLSNLNNIEKVIGTQFNDVFIGSINADDLAGGNGDDTFRGSAGNDTLDGGNGINTLDYSVLPVAAGVTGGIRADLTAQRIEKLGNGAVTSIDTVLNVENLIGTNFGDTMTGDAAANQLSGGAGDDTVQGSRGNDTLDGGAGVDTLDYSAMAVTAGTSAFVRVNLTTGTVEKLEDAIVVGTDTIVNIDNVIGSRFDDLITGSSNSDMFAGSAGNDTLTGSTGNDTFDGGTGSDTVDYSNLPVAPLATGGVRANLATETIDKLENGTVVGTDVVRATENVIGTAFNDTLGGNTSINFLSGGAGNDLFEGSTANDTLDGGSGLDTVDYSKMTGGIQADLAQGQTIKQSATGANQDTDIVRDIENVIGSTGADHITGDATANRLSGNEGDDTLSGLAGNDTLSGGAGADLIEGGAGNDLIVQLGVELEDSLDGGGGFDTLDYSGMRGAANTVLTLRADLKAEKIEKWIDGVFKANDYTQDVEGFIGSVNNDTVSGSSGDNLLDGGKGDDRLYQNFWAGFDTFEGGEGFDTLDYSGLPSNNQVTGINVNLHVGKIDKYANDGFAGRDVVRNIEQITGSAGKDTFIGSDEGTRMLGAAGNDILMGGTGTDALDGGDGDDTLNGGAGGDQIYGKDGNDLIVQNILWGDDKLEGGNGIDTVSYSAAAAAAGGITLDLKEGQVLKWQGTRVIGSDTLKDIENVIGTWADDHITGDANSNSLDGDEGNDTLVGSPGNDTLEGGSGTDTVDYSKSVRSISASLVSGTVIKFLANAADETDRIRNIESLIGTQFSDVLSGDGKANFLAGGDGNDRLSGGDGDDTLDSGNGNDTVDGGTGNDMLSYLGIAGGVDVNLETSAVKKYASESNTTLFTTDKISNVEHVQGSLKKDKITGNAGANLLLGMSGNDTLIGAAGDDTLNGGLDADSVSGGDGNDLFVQDEYAGNDTLDGGAGFDTVDYSSMEKLDPYDEIKVSVDLNARTATKYVKKFRSNDPAKDESYDPVYVKVGVDTLLNIEKVIATSFSDTLAGGGNSDQLYGLNDDDVIKGSLGSDTLDGGAGEDTLDYTTTSAMIKADLSVGTISKFNGTSLSTAAGTDSISNFEQLIGSQYGDSLVGSKEADVLSGFKGNDSINGGEGNDRLDGGEGNDFLLGEDGDDIITQEFWNASAETIDGSDGIDTLIYRDLSTNTDYYLEVDLRLNLIRKRYNYDNATLYMSNDRIFNVENFIGTSRADSVIGDDKNNKLFGGAGSDTLVGGAGDDTLSGEDDNDKVSGGDGNDLIIQTFLAGNDTLDGDSGVDTVDYSKVPLSAEPEKSGLTADLTTNRVTKKISDKIFGTDVLANIENLTASSFNDSIMGNAAGNALSGFHGDDTLNGAAGNDSLSGGSGNDRFIQSDLNGEDTIDGGNDSDTVDYSGLVTGARTTGGINASLLEGKVEKRNGGVMKVDSLKNIENLIGTASNDNIVGDANANELTGGAGADWLDGGSGNDRFIQSDFDGEDTIDGGSDVDTVLDGEDTIKGDSDIDTVDYSGLVTGTGIAGGINASLLEGKVEKRNGGIMKVDTLMNVENLIGTASNDSLVGDANANELTGGAGADWLDGGDGDDRFVQDGWDDADTINGGAGNDTLDYHLLATLPNSTASLMVDLDAGVVDKRLNGLLTGRDAISNIEHVIGSAFDDTLIGSDSGNVLSGGDGNDTLHGSAGNDTLDGGEGNDTLDYGRLLAANTVDEVLWDANKGKIYKKRNGVTVGADSISGIENILGYTATVTAADTALEMAAASMSADFGGTSGNDNLTGNAAANRMFGLGGADTLRGGAGNDTLSGGALLDYLYGDEGDDTFVQDAWLSGSGVSYVNAAVFGDMIDGGSGTDTLDYRQGDRKGILSQHIVMATGDTYQFDVADFNTSRSFKGSESFRNIENVIGSKTPDKIEGDGFANWLSGDDGNDALYGNAGNDTLQGGTGFDFITGGDGDDLLIQDSWIEADKIDGGAGIDTLNYSLGESGKSDGIGVDVDLLDGTAMQAVKQSAGTPLKDTIKNVENVTGSDFADRITGDDGANVLNGGKGADLIDGGAGDDVLLQADWAGNDTFIGGRGVDTLDFSGATAKGGLIAHLYIGRIEKFDNDMNAGIDQVSGFENILGTKFDDRINGSGTDDRFVGGDGNDELNGEWGDDTLDGGGGRDTLDGGEGNDQLQGGEGANLVNGDDGDDVFVQLVFESNDTLDGGNGTDTVDYSLLMGNRLLGRNLIDGAYGIRANLVEQSVTKLNAGQSTIDRVRHIENILGSRFADIIIGDASANLINAGAGADSVAGGDGDDYVIQDQFADADTLDGGEGKDTLDYRGLRNAAGTVTGIRVSLVDRKVEKLTALTTITDTISGFENIIGSGFNDTIIGDEKSNTLNGGTGADSLAGGAGNDFIIQDSFAGSDTIDGGTGIDTLDYSRMNAGQGVVANIRASLIDGKVDKINAGITASDAIRNIENLTGTGYNDTLIGDANANMLMGGAGNDSVDGGAGDDRIVQANWRENDTLKGGIGRDTLDYQQLRDGGVIADLMGSRILKKYDEVIIATDVVSGFETFIGTGFDDTITGHYATDEYLSGGAGNDSFVQLLLNGVDTLDGGEGSDTVDYTRLSNSSNVIKIAANLATGKINKIVVSPGTGASTTATETVMSIENVLGSSFNDTITGDGNDNILQGNADNDSVDGGAGNDRIVQTGWSESDTLEGGAGRDLIDYSSLPPPAVGTNYQLQANMASGRVDKLKDGIVIATDIISGFEIFTGSGFADVITGSALGESLMGEAENDTLNATLGNDTLDGGAGIDVLDYRLVAQGTVDRRITIHADLAAGRIEKRENGIVIGTDTISNVERVIGTDLDDLFTGSIGADDCSESSGNDTLIGSRGNDTLDGGEGVDRLDYTEMSYAGIDVWDAIKMELSVRADLESRKVDKLQHGIVIGTDVVSGMEDFIGTDFNDEIHGSSLAETLAGGDGNDSLYGSDGNDVLYGDLDDDTVDGGAGNDTLYGGLGNDALDGGSGDDTIVQSRILGNDTINGGSGSDTVDYSRQVIASDVEHIAADLASGTVLKFSADILLGTDTVLDIENLVGTLFNDKLTGNQFANVLNGEAGDDLLSGGGGNDTLSGGLGNDKYWFDASFGDVTVRDVEGEHDLVEIFNMNADAFSAVRSGLDLKMSRIDAPSSTITIADWYSGAGFQIEEFRIGNALITSSDMNLLVSTTPGSMAQFPRTVI